jgi:hypothetical protein
LHYLHFERESAENAESAMQNFTNTKHNITMAHMDTSDGINCLVGAISKKKSSKRLSVSRVKHFRDPLTGMEISKGPNEFYLQNKRNYSHAPLTAAEEAQKERWRAACLQAAAILRDRAHPRYAELYHRWRAQLNNAKPIAQFGNFIRAVLAQEQ